MIRKLIVLLTLFSLSNVAFAATLVINNTTDPVPGYQFYMVGGDLGDHSPLASNYNLPLATSPNGQITVPANESISILHCTTSQCQTTGYAGTSISWNTWPTWSAYSLYYGVNAYDYNTPICIDVNIDGTDYGNKCSQPSSYNGQNFNINNVFNENSIITITLSNPH